MKSVVTTRIFAGKSRRTLTSQINSLGREYACQIRFQSTFLSARAASAAVLAGILPMRPHYTLTILNTRAGWIHAGRRLRRPAGARSCENEQMDAAVIVHCQDGFALAGRNLREVEAREASLSQFAAVTWLLALIGTFVVSAASEFVLRERRYQAAPAAAN